MTDSTSEAYRTHHAHRGRLGFSLLEGERGALLNRLIGKGKRVLDLGCRDGTLTRHFAKGNEVIGADVDPDALAAAKESLGIATTSFDFNSDQWPLEHGSFDVVVAAEVIEHLYFPERVLVRIAGILKPGGMVVGSVPNAFSLECRLKYLVASKRGTPLADAMHINQFGWHEFHALLARQFGEVELYPLGKTWWGMRNLCPSLFSYGIGFSAIKK